MKKIAILAVFAVAMALFQTAPQQAHAASVVDTILAQAVSQNASAAKLQTLFNMKQAVEQGDKNVLVGILAKTAVEQLGRNGFDPVAATIQSGGNVNELVKNSLNQVVQKRFGNQIGQYQEGLELVATLLQNTGLYPKAYQDNNSLNGPPEAYRSVLKMTATAYGPGVEDNGRWGNKTYVGSLVRKGVVAVDPNVIPMGTKLWVEGYGPAVADDQGSAIKGNRIDLAFDTRQEALDYGIKPVKVYVLK